MALAKRRRFTVIVRLMVDEHTSMHLQTAHGIEEEVESWLIDLNADVEQVSVLRNAKEALS
jgi:hypothetical protein